jgi:hypothetical protein
MTDTAADTVRKAGTLMLTTADEVSRDFPTPPLLPSLGALLMALGDEMADYPAVHVPNGIGIESRPNQPSAVWTAAHRVATNYLDRHQALPPTLTRE